MIIPALAGLGALMLAGNPFKSKPKRKNPKRRKNPLLPLRAVKPYRGTEMTADDGTKFLGAKTQAARFCVMRKRPGEKWESMVCPAMDINREPVIDMDGMRHAVERAVANLNANLHKNPKRRKNPHEERFRLPGLNIMRVDRFFDGKIRVSYSNGKSKWFRHKPESTRKNPSKMLVFESGLDIRSRQVARPQVAKINMGGTTGYRYCIIGTPYGHIHTISGGVRTWKTAAGARKYLRENY